MARDIVAGTATRYGLEGPGIESRWRCNFTHPPITPLGPTQPPIKWGPDLYMRGKVAGARI